jgi:four helix bundle protein
MPKVERFEDLEVWKNARKLANMVYRVTQNEQFSKDFGLKDQVRRAAVSIFSNIAEGFESQSQKMFVDYLGRAKASAGELRAQLYLCLDLKYASQEEYSETNELALICSKQLARFIQYLRTQPNSFRVNEEGVTYHVSD